jgi:hypothetical protein
MIAALAAVQEGGQEDPNNYSPLDADDIDFNIDFEREEVAGIHVVVEAIQEESEGESSGDSSLYHLPDHYYCPSDDDAYSTSRSDDDESSTSSSMPGLQARAAEYSSSEDDDSVVSIGNNEDADSISFQGSVISSCNNDDAITEPTHSLMGFTQDVFDYNTTVPSLLPTSIHVIPPVSCVLIPNDLDDVNSSVVAPIIERIDPAGRVPIRIQQNTFRHVDDIVCHKPSLLIIGGEVTHNWA